MYGTFALPSAQKDRMDPSVGRSRVREAAPAAMPPPTEAREGCSPLALVMVMVMVMVLNSAYTGPIPRYL